jgi:hypothetical protein
MASEWAKRDNYGMFSKCGNRLSRGKNLANYRLNVVSTLQGGHVPRGESEEFVLG